MDTPRKKLLIMIGLVVGMLSFLFLIADTAISYSDNGKFCLNCHSMQEAVDSLAHSNHKQLKCTECHAPKPYIPKVMYKAKSGLHDLRVTLFGEVPQIIQANPQTKIIVQNNCVRCHATTVENTPMGDGRKCIDCHRQSAHNKVRS